MRLAALIALVAMGGCLADETLTGYGAADRIWVLDSIDGVAFAARAELLFPEEGKITGRGPCNQFFGDQRAPYPWFDVGPLGSTRMACPQLSAETAFFRALESMTLSEVAGDTLILSTEDGREMVFRAAAQTDQ